MSHIWGARGGCHASEGSGKHQTFSQIWWGCRWVSSPCGDWKAKTMSEMGGLEVVLKALWRVGSNRLESDGWAIRGCQRPMGSETHQI
jgi:hypothetical protein